MSPAVRAVFLSFTEEFEGGVPYFYNDIRGLTTIAYGNLVDPMSLALNLPMMHPGGTRATTQEIASAWQAVHNDPAAAVRGHTYARGLTKLRLTGDGMKRLALSKADANEVILVERFPAFATFPDCGQLALHSWAWACGSRAHFPKLVDAVSARDFEVAAIEVHMNEWTQGPTGERIKNAGLVPRNVANKILMRNAARVEAFHLDPSLIDWKQVFGVSEVKTVPALDNPASEPTICTHPILHADPSTYLDNKDDE